MSSNASFYGNNTNFIQAADISTKSISAFNADVVNLTVNTEPTDSTDAATKSYVDGQISDIGIHWKCSCRVTDTGIDVTLPATLTIDGVTVVEGERVLLRNQATALENGVYVVNGASELERSADMVTGTNAANFAFFVEEGDTMAGFTYVVTNDLPNDVVDTDVIVFGVFSGDPVIPGGTNGLLQYNNAGEFGGITTLSSNGTNVTLNGGNLNIQDTDELQIGDSSDVIIAHDATNSTITSKTGNFSIVNTLVTGSTIMKLGTATTATAFDVHSSADASRFKVTGNGEVTFGTFSSDGTNIILNNGDMTLNDNDELRFGDGLDLVIKHDGTNSSIVSDKGDFTIENENVTGSTIQKLGTTTTATDFQIQDSAASALLTVLGDGATSIRTSLTVAGNAVGAAQPYASFSDNIDRSYTTDSNERLLWGTQELLRGGITYDSGDQTFSVPTDGIYYVSYVVNWENQSAGTRRVEIAVFTGSISIYGTTFLTLSATSGPPSMSASAMIPLSDGDQIWIQIYHTKGSDQDIGVGDNGNSLQIYYMGP